MDGPVVFYDADCGFCRWSAARLHDWDRGGRLRFATIQGAEADHRLAVLDARARFGSWHLVEGDRIWSAGAAVGRILRYLPGGGPLAGVAETFPDETEGAYRMVARHRIQIGRALGARACAIGSARPDLSLQR